MAAAVDGEPLDAAGGEQTRAEGDAAVAEESRRAGIVRIDDRDRVDAAAAEEDHAAARHDIAAREVEDERVILPTGVDGDRLRRVCGHTAGEGVVLVDLEDRRIARR